ncbi:MAG TPA: hypothetical protein VGL72_20145 [Bryobacteraceae bacterium]
MRVQIYLPADKPVSSSYMATWSIKLQSEAHEQIDIAVRVKPRVALI